MHATILSTMRIVSNSFHNGFTSLCRWKDTYWLAYRQASSHGLVPPGTIIVLTSTTGTQWDVTHEIATTQTDYRDPKLIATSEMLRLMVGAYLPSPHLRHYGIDSLTVHSGDAQIWTFLTGTRDGATWQPLTPILRPNHWGWSAVALKEQWVLASYDTGALESRNTITLWYGTPRTDFRHHGVIYDGGALDKEGHAYRYTATMPSEPVLYYPAPDTLGCCLRTESTMLLGTWRAGKAWRWQDTGTMLHPSAVVKTPHGWLLATRELVQKPTAQLELDSTTLAHYEAQVALWWLEGNRLKRVLVLQKDAKDCGYCGVCEGERAGTYLVSYYSAHEAPAGLSDVYLAKVRIDA